MSRFLTFLLPLILVLGGCGAVPNRPNSKVTLPTSFPSDFSAPIDSAGNGQGDVISGWGGEGKAERNPVIFIHGNGVDADLFRGYATTFIERYGYQPSELWAFSFQGYPNRKPENRQTKMVTPHQNAVDDVYEMIERILAYTGKQKATLVTYSLGSTLGLHYLKKYDAYHKVDTFISIVGANHGFKGAAEGEEPEWTPDSIRELCVHSSGDETPYGRVQDEKVHLPPTAERHIRWVVMHAGRDDYMLNLHLKNWQQVDNSLTSELDGADINQSYEGVFDNLEKPFGAHISFYYQMEKIFPLFDQILCSKGAEE